MSLYVLDTDVLSLHQDGHPVVTRNVESHPPQEVALSVISVEEQLTGWYSRLRRTRKRDLLAQLYQRLATNVMALSGLPILSFTEPAILRYEKLQKLKLNVGKNDLRIAAITLENGGILVTRNQRDFQRVPNLTIEDWSV
jgi:tRNA(fMet)-specific endonuclease VapC